MTPRMDFTHDPSRTSWLESANHEGCDFPIQNLPFGRFRRKGLEEPLRIGVAIGDQALDLRLAADAGGWTAEVQALLAPLASGDLTALMRAGSTQRIRLRQALSQALATGSAQQAALSPCLIAQSALDMSLPCDIGDYTDFYTSIHHATRVGRLFRPDNPLLPNYRWVPIGYHGRASSILPSGTAFARPCGQVKGADDAPSLRPSQRLDYELELGLLTGAPNALGEPIPMARARDAMFGLTLFNDWSARDVQAWEYIPLGPFLGKNFASTMSTWVVTMEALEPYRVPFQREQGEPDPLPYLDSPENRAFGAYDIVLEVWLRTAKMQAAGQSAVLLSRANAREASYWTLAQLVVHHTVNGCNLRAGDLLGTGTLSGPTQAQSGSLLELSEGGKTPVQLVNGERRTFLEDGDSVTLRAWCERPGAKRIGFGECSGTVQAARQIE